MGFIFYSLLTDKISCTKIRDKDLRNKKKIDDEVTGMRAEKTNRAYGYVRVSKEDQAVSGLGIEAQRAAIKGYCEGHGLKLVGGADDTACGASPRRRGLLRVLDLLGAGDVLVVAKRDRLARDMMLSCWIEKEVARRGASIVSAAGEGTESDDPAARLMRQMVDAFAEYERGIISFRTTAALDAKRARGEVTGTVPYGFRRVRPESQTLESEPAEAANVEHAALMRARGKGYEEIAGALNRMGKRMRSDNEFTGWRVRQMLENNKRRKQA